MTDNGKSKQKEGSKKQKTTIANSSDPEAEHCQREKSKAEIESNEHSADRRHQETYRCTYNARTQNVLGTVFLMRWDVAWVTAGGPLTPQNSRPPYYSPRKGSAVEAHPERRAERQNALMGGSCITVSNPPGRAGGFKGGLSVRVAVHLDRYVFQCTQVCSQTYRCTCTARTQNVLSTIFLMPWDVAW